MNALSLSSLVLLAFLAAAAVFLLLAKLFARKPRVEIWLAAIALVLISSALLRILSERGLLLGRTPALIHAGFAALVILWAMLRREGPLLGPPAPATIRFNVVSWFLAIPVGGILLSLPLLWEVRTLDPELVGLLQISALGAAWLMTMRRTERAGEPADARLFSSGRTAAKRSSRPQTVEGPPPHLRIFLSYRREDSAHVTGRVYDRLVARFGRERVFKDVDSIPLGVDFRTRLEEVVGTCDVVVAVIGDHWLSAASQGSRRLDDARDFVRIELETALQRQIPVIPVLVGSARLPSAGDLPPTLAALVYRQGQAVRPDPDFHHDMDRLIEGIESGT